MPENEKSAASRFLTELHRRRVIRTMVAYIVGAWVVIEASSTIFPALHLPEWTVTFIVATAFLAFPVVAVLAWVFDIKRHPGSSSGSVDAAGDEPREETGPPATKTELASVAILPFESLSPDPGLEHVAKSIATELHQTLSRVHRLRVASRVSSFAFADKHVDVGEIGKALNVAYVITGSVTCVAKQMHVTVQLDDTLQGSHVWTQSYDRQQDDLLAVLRDIAEDVASAFGGIQLENEIRQAIAVPTESLSAWERVQRARVYLLDFSPGALDAAVTLLEESIELDPGYAAAQATLASVLGERVINGLSPDVDKDIDKATHLSASASELAPNDPFVLKLCGVVSAYFGDTERSLRLLRRSVSIAPYDFGAWGYLGWPLAATGSAEDLAELHIIMERLLDSAPMHPGAPYWLYHRSVAMTCQGRDDEAVSLAASSVEQHPRFPMAWFQYCNALGAVGRTQQARDAIDRAGRLGPALTPEYYGDIVRRMCRDEETAERRLAGLALVNSTAADPVT